ncbi:hypothetical protein O1Q96_02630 [Streptomyces sp. Qhu-G9]|uniref:hypothetical protein n=1 Tax=Streptomyces sp. Qhu-G9 TaxID=3452799 RepID=UPI0022AC064B|nr:hypothetical protein [Streptomyces aurantiacus]WAU78749.1 hypothetical protein O1Q96_02630 [Streptomyces aurantiacus]
MSAFSSDLDLNVQDVTGNGTEVDVATNLLNGDIRLSILWTQEILLSADSADQVALALQRAAEQARKTTANTTPESTTSTDQAQPKCLVPGDG